VLEIKIKEINTWNTRRQKLIKILNEREDVIELKSIMRELEYPNKRTLVEDINDIASTLKSEGKQLLVKPPSCIACGYIFNLKNSKLKIPSKCPNCREERIDWPVIKLKR
jgi:predicted Zn-ribbon and HTH transcriptional regulator